MHCVIADRLDADMLARARARVERWSLAGVLGPEYARRWGELLDRPVGEVAAALRRDDESMDDLRQCTPFAGELEPRERWAVLRSIGS